MSIEARRKKKIRPPEQTAQMTLREFEQWLALEVSHRYHHSEHRGLMGATPASAWQALTAAHAVQMLSSDPSKQLRFLIQFLPIATITIKQFAFRLLRSTRQRFLHRLFTTR